MDYYPSQAFTYFTHASSKFLSSDPSPMNGRSFSIPQTGQMNWATSSSSRTTRAFLSPGTRSSSLVEWNQFLGTLFAAAIWSFPMRSLDQLKDHCTINPCRENNRFLALQLIGMALNGLVKGQAGLVGIPQNGWTLLSHVNYSLLHSSSLIWATISKSYDP